MVQLRIMEQSTNTVDPLRAWEELQGFNPALDERINQMQQGADLNGHHPNGVLTGALEGGKEERTTFVQEYAWLIALEGYPFRDQEKAITLRAAGIDALFAAGETYDPNKEPNFLIHSAKTISEYLEEIFGAPTYERPIPFEALTPPAPQVETPEEIAPPETKDILPSPVEPEEMLDTDDVEDTDTLHVIEPSEEEDDLEMPIGLEDTEPTEEAVPEQSTQKAKGPRRGRKGKKHKPTAKPGEASTALLQTDPCLPNARTAESLVAGQRVLYLQNNRLCDAVIEWVRPYTHSWTNEVTPIPEANMRALREAYEERKAALEAGRMSRPSIKYAKPHFTREPLNANNIEMTNSELAVAEIMPDPELLRLALAMQPAFHKLVPRKSPGCLKIVSQEEPGGIITDVNINRIIPLPDWEKLKSDPDYQYAWHASGTVEDQRETQTLAEAIRQRRREKPSKTSELEPGQRRANPRSAMTHAMARALLHSS